MRFSITKSLLVAAVANGAVASTWFGKAAYNKWHETELERWLSDHNVPYPTPSDRKDLENLVKNNWNDKVVTPYKEWEVPQLQNYLKAKGEDVEKDTSATKDDLVAKVKTSWTDTSDTTSNAYGSVRDWIFDSWTESQLKAFCDKHGIPSPSPRKRDTLLTVARENYKSSADKLSELSQYPGDWLYSTWSESDFKEWLDERGVPVPQPTTRDKLIASVRRNSRQASLNIQAKAAAASSSAANAQESLSDAVFDAWSDSKIKEWADKNGIKVPQGSKRNDLLAIARKHRAQLLGDTAASSVSSAVGGATTKAGNEYAKATDDAQLQAENAFEGIIGTWSDSRLKEFLDSRGVPVPQNGKRDELLAKVRLNKHKAANGFGTWTFDTWTTDNLKSWLTSQNKKAADKAGSSRNDLLKGAQSAYAEASKSGGGSYASVTSYLASATDSAKDSTFDTWSESELKNYLDSYGISTYQGSTLNELRAAARRNANYFRYGTTTPQGTLWGKLQDSAQWVLSQLKVGAASGRQEASAQAEKASEAASGAGKTASRKAEDIKSDL